MNAGFYGKMPCKGDFVGRGLPRNLLNRLDPWLQQGMLESRQQLGEEWLDAYLVSPVWHFYLAAGVVDDGAWSGVLVPSVDRVGRYFPCLVMLPLASDLPDLAAFEGQSTPLLEAEELLLDSLAPQFDFDGFCQRVAQLRAAAVVDRTASAPVPVLPLLRNIQPQRDSWRHLGLAELAEAPCLWASEGSETIAAQLFVSDGLPDPSHFSQFLTGAQALDAD